MTSQDSTADIKPGDLRGILKYVPQFRDHTFVISLDGRVIEDENFANIALDLAVLRSLNINLVLTHGIGHQLTQMAVQQGVEISDVQGQGVTDETTLRLASAASAVVGQKLMQGLVRAGLRPLLTHAARATEMGVIGGKDHQFTGKLDKVDTTQLEQLIRLDTIPIISPVLFDREGRTLRLNSDHLGAELAIAMKASKLIFLTAHQGLTVRGKFLMNVPLSEVETILEKTPLDVDEPVRSKAVQAIRAVRGGVPRAHLLDGRTYDGLLTEIFSKVGIGTMIHGNDYQKIRKARRRDAQAIYNLTKGAVKSEQLKHRTRQSIEKDIESFYLYEIDESVIACACLTDYPADNACELAYLFVVPFYQGKGVGGEMVRFALAETRRLGRGKLFVLTTQTLSYFKHFPELAECSPEELPPERLEALQKSGRNSRVLVHRLG